MCNEDSDMAKAYQVDVTDRESLAEMLNQIHAQLGTLNIVCANAGIAPPLGPVTHHDDNDWDFAFSVNVMGVIRTIDTCFDDMIKNSPDAHIMITASMGGVMVRGHMPLGAYSPSKFAVVGYGEELRHQLKESGIGVSLLCPGLIDTPIANYSAQTRPEKLGSQDEPVKTGLSPRLEAMAITPGQVADVALQGIRDNRFYIATHKGTVDRLRPHFEAMLREIDAQGVEPGLHHN